MKKILFTHLVFLVCINYIYGVTIKVPLNYSSIQEAIEVAANGDTVLVDEGTYLENIDFLGKNIVVGSQFMIDHDPSHILATVIDGSSGVQGVNGSCVAFLNGEDSTAVIQGFTLTGGSGTAAEQYIEGGGVLLIGSSATVKNNLIKDNAVPNGGGGISTFRPSSKAHIYNNIILNNVGSSYGGGIVLNWTGGIVRNNIILNNTAGAAFGGGGVLIWDVSGETSIVENNTIIGNISQSNAGAIQHRVSGSPVIRNNIIWSNQQLSGQEVSILGSAIFESNDLEGVEEESGNISISPAFSDTLFMLKMISECIDAGSSDPIYNDIEDEISAGSAAFPSRGTLVNDMGAYGGPYAEVFPELAIENVYIPGVLCYYMDVDDTLTQYIDILNSGSKDFLVDSIVFPDMVEGLKANSKFEGFTLEIFESDSIEVTMVPTTVQFIIDTVKIYHQASTIPNPISVPFTLDTEHSTILGELEEDLRAHWKMDESSGTAIDDEIGFSNGTVTAETHRINGADGMAVGFCKNERASYITVPHTDSIEFEPDQSFSISMLFKGDMVNYTNEVFYLIKGTTSAPGLWYALSSKNQQIRFNVDDNSVKSGISYNVPADFEVNQWHHIIGVRDRASDMLYLYIDGEQVAISGDNTEGSIASGLPLLMDNFSATGSALDDVRIYSKALTGLHAKALYLSYNFPGLSSDDSVESLVVEDYEFMEGSFTPGTTNYTVYLQEGTSRANTIIESADVFATVTGDGFFSNIPGDQEIVITSEDGSESTTYYISFIVPAGSEDPDQNGIMIFPNPAKTSLQVLLNEDYIRESFSILNSSGAIIQQGIIEKNSFTMDVSDLSPGLYLLKLADKYHRIAIR